MARPTLDLENIMCCCDGTIKNTKTGNVLKPYKMKKGHLQISHSHKGVVKKHLAHRVIAHYFCDNPYKKPCVNHIDGDPANNNYINLEWVTDRENKEHARVNGMFQQSTKRYNAVFNEQQILTIHSLNWSHSKIARHYGVAQSVITRIKNFNTYKNYRVIING